MLSVIERKLQQFRNKHCVTDLYKGDLQDVYDDYWSRDAESRIRVVVPRNLPLMWNISRATNVLSSDLTQQGFSTTAYADVRWYLPDQEVGTLDHAFPYLPDRMVNAIESINCKYVRKRWQGLAVKAKIRSHSLHGTSRVRARC